MGEGWREARGCSQPPGPVPPRRQSPRATLACRCVVPAGSHVSSPLSASYRSAQARRPLILCVPFTSGSGGLPSDSLLPIALLRFFSWLTFQANCVLFDLLWLYTVNSRLIKDIN